MVVESLLPAPVRRPACVLILAALKDYRASILNFYGTAATRRERDGFDIELDFCAWLEEVFEVAIFGEEGGEGEAISKEVSRERCVKLLRALLEEDARLDVEFLSHSLGLDEKGASYGEKAVMR